MWFLRTTNESRLEFALLIGKQYTVGRKDCHILLSSDQSISRKHAVLSVEAYGSERDGTLQLEDLSKYGTQLNDLKCEKGTKSSLQSGDRIRFGGLPTSDTFIVEKQPFVVCSSGMKSVEQKTIQSLLHPLGGSITPKWTKQCSVLVMNSLTVTQKVLSALASCKPIVTLKWIKQFVHCSQEQKPLPFYESYLPPITDKNVEKSPSLFYPDESRRTIFTGKVFWLLSRQQYSDYEGCITAAGGECRLCTPPSLDVPLSETCMLVGLGEEEEGRLDEATRTWVQALYSTVNKNGYRKIHDTEIVRAILYGKTTNFCNPASQPVSMGTPLPPPSMSQFSCQTQGNDSQAMATQCHSQVSLLKEDISQAEFKMPSLPIIKDPQESSSVEHVEKKVGYSTAQSLDCSFERSVLAPDSLPGLSSQVSSQNGASFVAQLFRDSKKRMHSSDSSDEGLLAKKMDLRISKNIDTSTAPPASMESVDVGDVFGFTSCILQNNATKVAMETDKCDQKRGGSPQPCENALKIKRNSRETSSTSDDQGVQRNNFSTGPRRPKRFASSSSSSSITSRGFISVRKSSKAYYHPPITNDDRSKILGLPGMEADPAEKTERYSEEDDGTSDSLFPVIPCPKIALLRQSTKSSDESKSSLEPDGKRVNYKTFTKIQPLVSRTNTISRNQMIVHHKQVDDIRNPFSFQEEDSDDERQSQENNLFLMINKFKVKKKKNETM